MADQRSEQKGEGEMTSAGETRSGAAAACGGVDRRKTAFSVTCTRLSQYIKEKRGFIAGSVRKFTVPYVSEGIRTLNLVTREEDTKAPDLELFPRRLDFLPPSEIADREPAKSQLTIFYGGKVVVFDNFPAEKAQDLMHHAVKVLDAGPKAVTPPLPHLGASAVVTAAPIRPSKVSHPTSSDMPIARSASLHRFLVKRKERVTAVSPYRKPTLSPASVADAGDVHSNWLGLRGGLHDERQRSDT